MSVRTLSREDSHAGSLVYTVPPTIASRSNIHPFFQDANRLPIGIQNNISTGKLHGLQRSGLEDTIESEDGRLRIFLERLRPQTFFEASKTGPFFYRPGSHDGEEVLIFQDDPLSESPSSISSSFGNRTRERRHSTSSDSEPDDASALRKQLDAIKDPVEGTCEWILQCPEYSNWREQRRPLDNVLVIIGGLGSGKSVLVKSLCQRLEKQHRGIVVPFICKADAEGRNSTTSMLATFCYVLLSKGVLERPSDYLSDALVANASELKFSDLFDLFLELTNNRAFARYVWIIDALDECDVKSQQLFQSSLFRAKSRLRAKILITARNAKYPDLLALVRPSIHIQPEHVSEDALRILKHEIDTRGYAESYSEDMVEFIKKTIVSGIEGMLLMIEAKLNDFDDATLRDDFDTSKTYLRSLFNKFPPALEDFYASVLRNRVPQSEEKAREAATFLNILLACQKESVTEAELKHAFDFSRYNTQHEKSEVDDDDEELDLFARLRGICGPILRVQKNTRNERCLSFAHSSARTFLTRSGDRLSNEKVSRFLGQLRMREGHTLLAKACISYMMQPNIVRGSRLLFSELPFLSYSMRYWHVHVKESSSDVSEYHGLLAKFLSNDHQGPYLEWSNFVRRQRNEFGTAPGWWQRPFAIAITLVEHRLENLLELLHVQTVSKIHKRDSPLSSLPLDLEAYDDFGRTPLIIAIENEDFDLANHLLDKGAAADTKSITGTTPLHLAIMKGNEQMIKRLCQEGTSINEEACSTISTTPSPVIMLAVAGPLRIFKLLLDAGALEFKRTCDNWTILHEAALRSDFDKVRLILDRGLVDVNSRSNGGYSPLMVACGAGGSIQITRYLLDSGADIDHLNVRGSSALYEAAYHGNSECIAELLTREANFNTRKDGWTPLFAAAYNGDEDSIQRLIDIGMDVDEISPEGDTALMIAVQRNNRGAVYLLLNADVNIETVNQQGQNACYLAVLNADADILSKLLKFSKDPAAASKFGTESWSCLHAAAFDGKLDVVQQLVKVRKSQSDVDEIYLKRGWTPLMAAIRRGQCGVAKYLLELGADPNVTAANGWNVIHMICCYTKDEELLRKALKKTTKVTLSGETERGSKPLSLAAEKGFGAAVEILVRERGVNTMVCNNNGCTPLYYATKGADIQAIKALLSAEHMVNVRTIFGWTALHAAAMRCPAPVIRELLDKTDWLVRPQKTTPLHIAVTHGNWEAFQTLIDAGFDPDTRSGWGSTPLFEAAICGQDRMMRRLVDLGASRDAHNWGNYLPISGAYNIKDAQLIQLLRPSESLVLRASVNSLDLLIHGSASISLDEVKWAMSRKMRPFARNAYGHNCLSIASECGKDDIVEFLLSQDHASQYGKSAVHLTGWTPMHLAARMRHTKCLQALIEKKAFDPMTKDCFGLTAFDYAWGASNTWLALCRAYPSAAPSKTVQSTQSSSLGQTMIHQLCQIIDWRLNQFSFDDYQFDEADAHLTFYIIIDVLLRLKDERNAVDAVIRYLAMPSFRMSPKIACAICHRTQNSRLSVCKQCPFRTICSSCRDKTKTRNLRGCFQHSFLESGSDADLTSFFVAVSEKQDISERQWLEQLRKIYEMEKEAGFDQSRLPPLHLGAPKQAKEFFSLLDMSGISLLIDHLHENPRDIALRDGSGRNLAMHIIQQAKSDELCLQNLYKIARQGAKLLAYDKSQRSTIHYACVKKFRHSLKFILEEWDPEFDTRRDLESGTRGDPNAAAAVNLMVSLQWRDALELAVSRHFEWAASQEFTKLRAWSSIGLPDKAIVAKLMAEIDLESNTPSTLSVDGPWDHPPPIQVNVQPLTITHFPGCVHSISDQLKHPTNENMEVDIDTDDCDSGQSDLTPDSEQEFALDARDAMDEAMRICGIGGLWEEQAGADMFTEATDRGREVTISYSTTSAGSSGGPAAVLENILRAGDRLVAAIGVAQQANLCCTQFTIPTLLEKQTSEGHSIVRLRSIGFHDIEAFVTDLRKALKNVPATSPMLVSRLKSCASHASTLLRCFNIDAQAIPDGVQQIKLRDTATLQNLHHCSLIMQLLCLGFVSYLAGHKSDFQLPSLTCKVSLYKICGSGKTEVFRVYPQRMACVGNMTGDCVLTLSTSSKNRYSINNVKTAYLQTTLVDLLELHGVDDIVPETNDNGETTGRILLVNSNAGILAASSTAHDQIKLAHWSQYALSFCQFEAFTPDEDLLIGGLRPSNHPCRFDMRRAWDEASISALQPLGTRSPSWLLTERQVGMTLNANYISLNGVKVQTLQRGLSIKQEVLLQWSKPVGRLDILNKPFGLVLSICSGYAERVPIRVAISRVFQAYLAKLVIDSIAIPPPEDEWKQLCNELFDRLAGTGADSVTDADRSFEEYCKMAPRRPYWQLLRSLISYILEDLQHTGYDPGTDKFKVAWAGEQDPSQCFEFSCKHSNEFRWLKILRDSTKMATFAVASSDCLVVHQDSSIPLGPGTSCRCRKLQTTTIPPNQFRLLQTRVLPQRITPGEMNLQDWQLQEKTWYTFQLAAGLTVVGRVDHLKPRGHGQIVKVLLVFKPRDRLIQDLGAVKRALTKGKDYIQEQKYSMTASKNWKEVSITTKNHWLESWNNREENEPLATLSLADDSRTMTIGPSMTKVPASAPGGSVAVRLASPLLTPRNSPGLTPILTPNLLPMSATRLGPISNPYVASALAASVLANPETSDINEAADMNIEDDGSPSSSRSGVTRDDDQTNAMSIQTESLDSSENSPVTVSTESSRRTTGKDKEREIARPSSSGVFRFSTQSASTRHLP